MKNQTVIIGVVILVVILGAIFFIGRRKKDGDEGKTPVAGSDMNILPSIGGDNSVIVPFSTWFSKRNSENWAFNTKLI